MSFMLETTLTAGSINSTDAEKRRLAAFSGTTNLKNPTFCELFPEMVLKIDQAVPRQAEVAEAVAEPKDRAAAEAPVQDGGSMLSNAVLLAVIAAFVSLVWNVLSVA